MIFIKFFLKSVILLCKMTFKLKRIIMNKFKSLFLLFSATSIIFCGCATKKEDLNNKKDIQKFNAQVPLQKCSNGSNTYGLMKEIEKDTIYSTRVTICVNENKLVDYNRLHLKDKISDSSSEIIISKINVLLPLFKCNTDEAKNESIIKNVSICKGDDGFSYLTIKNIELDE